MVIVSVTSVPISAVLLSWECDIGVLAILKFN